MKKSVLAFLVLASVLETRAQQFEQDMKRMDSLYKNLNSFSMEIALKIYEHGNYTNPAIVSNGSVKKNKDLYFSDILGKIALTNKNCKLLIDESNKVIIYTSVSTKRVEGNDQLSFSNEELMQLIHAEDSTNGKNPASGAKEPSYNYKYLSKDQSRNRVEVKFKNNDVYEKIEIVYSAKTYALEEIVYYNKYEGEGTGQKVVISYSKIKLNNNLPASVFSETAYLKREGNKLVPIGEWADYKLVDQTNYKK